MTGCWSPARANSAAGVAYGWFCSGAMGCWGYLVQQKAELEGRWDKSLGCDSVNGVLVPRKRGSGCPPIRHRPGLLGGLSGDKAVNLVCIASRNSYRVLITSLTMVQELLCHHKHLCYCGSRLSDVSHALHTDIAHLQRATAAPAVWFAITPGLEGGCFP